MRTQYYLTDVVMDLWSLPEDLSSKASCDICLVTAARREPVRCSSIVFVDEYGHHKIHLTTDIYGPSGSYLTANTGTFAAPPPLASACCQATRPDGLAVPQPAADGRGQLAGAELAGLRTDAASPQPGPAHGDDPEPHRPDGCAGPVSLRFAAVTHDLADRRRAQEDHLWPHEPGAATTAAPSAQGGRFRDVRM